MLKRVLKILLYLSHICLSIKLLDAHQSIPLQKVNTCDNICIEEHHKLLGESYLLKTIKYCNVSHYFAKTDR